MGEWLTKFWKKPEPIEIKKETVVIDMMKDDVDPDEVTIENAYKTRWIWYHTILGILMLFANLIMLAIFLLLAIKL